MKSKVLKVLTACVCAMTLCYNPLNVAAASNSDTVEVPFALKTSDNSTYITGADLEVVNSATNESEKWTSSGEDKILSLKAGAYSYKITKLPQDYETSQVEFGFCIMEDGKVVKLTQDEQAEVEAANQAEKELESAQNAAKEKKENSELAKANLDKSIKNLKKTYNELVVLLIGDGDKKGTIESLGYDASVLQSVTAILDEVNPDAPYEEFSSKLTNAIDRIKAIVPILNDADADREALEQDAAAQIETLNMQLEAGTITQEVYNEEVFEVESQTADTCQRRELARKAIYGSFAENEACITRVITDSSRYDTAEKEYLEEEKSVKEKETLIDRRNELINNNTISGTVELVADKKVITDKKNGTEEKVDKNSSKSNSSVNNNKTVNSQSVKTGDDNALMKYLILITLSLFSILALVAKRRKC